MIIVGLTGQSGAGKTTVSNTFLENGFGVINCDLISRRVNEDGSECNKKLAEVFPTCFDKAFVLDRHKLAEIVFSDESKLELLNCIVFPFITQMIKDEIDSLKAETDYVLIDAPTLFEAGADKLCHKIVSVIADKEKRFTRIKNRDKIDDELIERRFASQHSVEFFIKHSDYIIENNKDFDDTILQTNSIIKEIKGIY